MLPRLGLLGQGIELKEKQGQLNGLGCVTLKLYPTVEVSFVCLTATVDLVEVSFVSLTATVDLVEVSFVCDSQYLYYLSLFHFTFQNCSPRFTPYYRFANAEI